MTVILVRTAGDGKRQHIPVSHNAGRAAEHHAVIAIDTGTVLVGELPSRALKLVNERATLHHAELKANWTRARDGGAPEPIDPLP
jgi:Domain of unknown function (DUF4160)